MRFFQSTLFLSLLVCVGLVNAQTTTRTKTVTTTVRDPSTTFIATRTVTRSSTLTQLSTVTTTSVSVSTSTRRITSTVTSPSPTTTTLVSTSTRTSISTVRITTPSPTTTTVTTTAVSTRRVTTVTTAPPSTSTIYLTSTVTEPASPTGSTCSDDGRTEVLAVSRKDVKYRCSTTGEGDLVLQSEYLNWTDEYLWCMYAPEGSTDPATTDGHFNYTTGEVIEEVRNPPSPISAPNWTNQWAYLGCPGTNNGDLLSDNHLENYFNTRTGENYGSFVFCKYTDYSCAHYAATGEAISNNPAGCYTQVKRA